MTEPDALRQFLTENLTVEDNTNLINEFTMEQQEQIANAMLDKLIDQFNATADRTLRKINVVIYGCSNAADVMYLTKMYSEITVSQIKIQVNRTADMLIKCTNLLERSAFELKRIVDQYLTPD